MPMNRKKSQSSEPRLIHRLEWQALKALIPSKRGVLEGEVEEISGESSCLRSIGTIDFSVSQKISIRNGYFHGHFTDRLPKISMIGWQSKIPVPRVEVVHKIENYPMVNRGDK